MRLRRKDLFSKKLCAAFIPRSNRPNASPHKAPSCQVSHPAFLRQNRNGGIYITVPTARAMCTSVLDGGRACRGFVIFSTSEPNIAWEYQTARIVMCSSQARSSAGTLRYSINAISQRPRKRKYNLKMGISLDRGIIRSRVGSGFQLFDVVGLTDNLI